MQPVYITIIISAFVAIIVFMQYRIAFKKVKIDLYNLRFPIIKKLQSFIALININAKIKFSDFQDLNSVFVEMSFLFDKDINKYVEQIRHRAAHLLKCVDSYRDINTIQFAPSSYDHEKIVTGMNEELLWFSQQLEKLITICKKYCYFGDIK